MRTNPYRFIYACIFVLLSVMLRAQTANENQQIDKLVKRFVDLDQFSGSILVAKKGNIVLSKGYGLANREWNVANATNTKFRIASLTKQFTAMLVMQLYQEGKIDLSGHISDYLPYYRKDIGTRVTIHQLLSHTSGLGDFGSRDDFWEICKTEYAPREFVEKYCSGNLEAEPGLRYRYSNSGYYILGAIIESLRAKPHHEVLKERILDVIGMNNSGMEMRKEVVGGQASGYNLQYGKYTKPDYVNLYAVIFSAGGMYSTVGDLLKWDRALYTEQLLSNKNLELMFKPNMEKYAYGIVVNKMKIPELAFTSDFSSHTGAINGFRSIIVRESSQQQVIIILGNTAPGSTIVDLSPLSNKIYSVVNGLHYENPKPEIVQAMALKIINGSVDEGISFYRKEKAQKNGRFEFNLIEGELNTLGYYLLSQGKKAEALEIFKLNTTEFPLSWNVFDSYAEALEAAGQKKDSIKNYKRSIELNADNTHAKERLKLLTEK
ncbi:serine hydrolase domain-containing protein [Pedobacter caeni]|uniref:CubicO group peptidase, beta-lactamase class C family n=1 Tax=Pedobacter caeni TaxID=288992 RepID=A0A1M5H7C1_9SPHI|nr:serine hydrolase domain-containing protein [Pedobacter caeni]SHG11834.1 CubicO group peptidase, beta-lactamase class C family [Pedobacter caeni]